MTVAPAWTRGEAERAAKAMFGNQALHRAAAAMAGCHPRALDYIRQAPVIVLAENHGRTGPDAAARARQYAGPPMRMLCERGARLREVMAFYGCAFQLRQLAPSVLHPVRWAVIDHLGHLPPSTLAQIIPPARGQQDIWLRALTRWADHCERRAQNRWFRFDWAAVALRTTARGQEDTVTNVADLAIEAARSDPRGDAVFDPRWTLPNALGATDRWHRALARAHAERRAVEGLGVAFTAAVDYVPFPNGPTEVDGLSFVPLRTCEDLWVEGAAMHHCVGSYSADVMRGSARIFSVLQDGRRVATIEFANFADVTDRCLPDAWSKFRVIQIKGPCNTKPAKAVFDAVARFSDGVREAIKAAGPLRQAFPDITARFFDETLPPIGSAAHPTPQASPGPGA